jgi:hypothetical protein
VGLSLGSALLRRCSLSEVGIASEILTRAERSIFGIGWCMIASRGGDVNQFSRGLWLLVHVWGNTGNINREGSPLIMGDSVRGCALASALLLLLPLAQAHFPRGAPMVDMLSAPFTVPLPCPLAPFWSDTRPM